MKNIIKLTEKDLSRIVKRVINEDISENELYLNINNTLNNSNSSEEEKIQVLKHILDQKEGKGWITKDRVRKLWNMNEKEI